MKQKEQVTQADPIRVFLDEARRNIYPCPDKPDSMWAKWKAADEAHRLTHTEPQDASRPNEGLAACPKCQKGAPIRKYNSSPAEWLECDHCGFSLGPWEETWNELSALRTQEAPPEAVEAPFDKADCVKCGTNPHAIELCLDCQNKFFAALSEQPRTDAAGMRELVRDLREAGDKLGDCISARRHGIKKPDEGDAIRAWDELSFGDRIDQALVGEGR